MFPTPFSACTPCQEFAAITRLPKSWSYSRKIEFADRVIGDLGLDKVRESLVGDETTRGISGGERKRVNIGIELAADPSVLLLDEPTSGLDSTASMQVRLRAGPHPASFHSPPCPRRQVCDALRRIAEQNITVALVLHQPRYEIFARFDDLVLLGALPKPTLPDGASVPCCSRPPAALAENCGGRATFVGPVIHAQP